MKNRNRKSKKWLIVPFLALATYGITQLAHKYPSFTEQWYSQGVYPFIAKLLSSVSNSFPFSLDDIFYLILIIHLLLVFVLMILKKIPFVRGGKTILNILGATYIFFYVLWGFNYFRQDLYQRLELKQQETNTEFFIQQLKTQIEITNQSWYPFENMDYYEIDGEIEKSYKSLAPPLKLKYPAGKRRAKEITLSNIFAKAGISGYYGPFFNEVHVNSLILPVEYPFVLAHEKAHQFGITNEAEANFYAWLVCTNSNSKQLQYSANLHILRYFLFQGYQLEEYPEIVKNLDKKVKQDLQCISENWKKLRNEKIDKAASKANDIYLKSNKIEKGIQSYRGVLKFILDFSSDTEFQQKHNLKPY